MKSLEFFDPAMCCSTGVCGPSIDPELLRVSTVVNVLNKKGFSVKRHNLSQEPQDFVANKTISQLLVQEGVGALPITLLDGEVVKKAGYPTNDELASWLGVNKYELTPMKMKQPSNCCGGNTGCC
jgi:hypothetical protein